MPSAKLSLAIAVTVLVAGEMVCAPICDLNCSVYGSPITIAKTDSNDGCSTGHCHKHGRKPEPDRHESVPRCPGKAHMSARTEALVTQPPVLHANAQASGTVPAFFHLGTVSDGQIRLQPTVRPDRSPPPISTLRI
jgi:hypothetical protein